MGAKNIIICDTRGAIYRQRTINMNPQKVEMAHMTNPEDVRGPLSVMIKDADMFIGVSEQGTFLPEYVSLMKDQPI